MDVSPSLGCEWRRDRKRRKEEEKKKMSEEKNSEKNQIQEKKETKTKKQQEKVMKDMNEQSSFVSFLVYLLAEFCEIEIIRPHTKATRTLQFPNIHRILLHEESIDFEELIKQRIELRAILFRKDCIEEKTVRRRCQSIRRQEIILLLEDLLYEQGISIIEEQHGKNTLIFIGNATNWKCLTKQEVVTKGNQIAEMFNTKLDHFKQFVYHRTHDVYFL